MSFRADHFIALKTSWFAFDNLFKVFVRSNLLCGARIAGQFFDRDAAYRQLVAPAQIFAPLMAKVAERLVRKRKSEERRYEEVDVESAEFLRMHSANFHISRDAVDEVTFDGRRSWWTAKNCGRMTLRVCRQKPMRFVLVSEAPDQIISMLQPLALPIRVIQ